MTFDLRLILIFSAAALLYNTLLPVKWRGWALLIGSVIALYSLQPPLAIRFSDYILPAVTLVLTVAMWWFTRKPDEAVDWRAEGITLAVITALVIGLAFMRFVDAAYRLTPSRPPEPLMVMAGLALAAFVVAVIARAPLTNRTLLTALMLLIVGLFVALKTEPFATAISAWWRGQTGQDASLASIADLNWLGFSYVAFRLIHTLRDRQNGLLPGLSLREYITYVIFFPAFTAGPIDRAERFVDDLRAPPTPMTAARLSDGASRIMLGLLKKFVIADSLAQGMSLNATNAAQAHSTVWLWVLLYGYGLRLFFDFSGYSDIAIGVGLLFGVKLPENFDRPYFKTSVTAFWQSWHMTLSNWARFYVFSPFSRWLLMRPWKPSPAVIVLFTQIATMVVIGLWHGVTWNFLIWGLWHGVGLFIHKQWTDRTRKWYRGLNETPRRKRLWTALTWLLTFHYVLLGWVWFALPDVGQSLNVFGQLLGAR